MRNLEEKYKSCEMAKTEVERQLQGVLTELQELHVKADQTSVQTVSLQQSVQETEETKAELQRCIQDLQAKHDNLNRKNTELVEKYDVVVEEKIILGNKIEEVSGIGINILFARGNFLSSFLVHIYSLRMSKRKWSTRKRKLPLKLKL